MIEEFIQSRYGDLSGRVSIWWRKESGAKAQYDSSKWFSWPEQKPNLFKFVDSIKSKDICFTVATYDIDSRTPEHAQMVNFVWMDSDTCEAAKYHLTPSRTVTTSVGRWQHYWDLSEPVSAAEASEVSHRMSIAHKDDGADPSSWAPNKIMRIPGTHNTSHGFPELVTETTTGEVYLISDLSGAYDNVVVPERAKLQIDSSLVAEPDDLPDYGDTLEKLSVRVLEMALSEPHDDQDRSRLRYKLLMELLRDGLDFDEVLSIAWHAPASRKWQEDQRGFAGLVAEANKAFAEFGNEQPISSDMPWEFDATEPVVQTDVEVKLLDEGEIVSLVNELTFIDRYVEHAGTRVPKQNEPYDRMNAWIVLSASLAGTGFIPRRNGPEPLNMYCMTLGDTTTGKSAARKFKLGVLNEFYKGDPEFNLGGNPSPNGLSRKLVERDGKVSYYNKDEAHGSLKLWAGPDGAGWTTGLLEDFADIYDGKITGSLRAKAEEGEGKTAETFFIMDLMGTPKAMIAALHRDLFLSGFLARFQWTVGEPREVSYDSMAEEDSEVDSVRLGFDPVSREFAAELRDVQRDVTVGTVGRVPVAITRKAAKRLQDAKWQLNQMFEKDQNWEILEPSLVRMGVTVRKAASLIALTEGLTKVDMRHILVALRASEEWVSNLVSVASRISASDWQRACEEILLYVQQNGGSVRKDRVARRFKHVELRFFSQYLEALKAQNLIKEVNDSRRVPYLDVVKKEEK